MRILATCTLALLVAACGPAEETTFVAPGVRVETTDADGTVRVHTAGGTIEADRGGDTARISGPGGTTEIDAAASLDGLGVPLPDGVRPKQAARPVAHIRTPVGETLTAALVTELSPAEVEQFYAERLELQTRVLTGDSAHLTAVLDDGARVTVHLGSPKDGLRDLAVMVVRSAR